MFDKLPKATVFLLLLIFCNQIFSQGAVFLMIYPGARQVGMAGAFTGIADDALATYYNPGGLAFQHNINFSLTQANWLEGLYPGMKYYNSSLVLPISNITMGLSWIYLGTGKTEVYDENGNYLGEYDTYDMSPAISIGRKFSSSFGVGGTFKYVHSFLVPEWVLHEFGYIGEGTGKAFAFDFGMLFNLSTFGKTGFGLVIQNIGDGIKYSYSGGEDPLPTALRCGFSQKISLKDLVKNENEDWLISWLMESSKLTIAYDFYYSLVRSSNFWQSVGTEICFAPIAFRFGYFYDPDGGRKGRTIGFGIDLDYLQINVASDADIYEFGTENLRYDLSLKLPDKIKF
jgi:hypothetical protein